MATTLGPSSGVAPPPGQPPDHSKSARQELARREDPTARIVRVVLLLVAVLVLVRGWMVTEIEKLIIRKRDSGADEFAVCQQVIGGLTSFECAVNKEQLLAHTRGSRFNSAWLREQRQQPEQQQL